MVAALVPKLESVVVVNLARPMLLAAQECEERGDLIGCGVRLREAIRRQLHAMCNYFACLPKSKRRPTPAAMLAALERDGQVDKWGKQMVQEMIDLGNAAAHCGRVDRASLRGSMGFLHYVIDINPCGDCFERFPAPSVYDIDDCDDGDATDWKGGAV
jgi:hypothetical protein